MIDPEKIKEATRLFLEGIGEDPDREGLIDTPNRVARMCAEIYGGMDEDARIHLSRTFEAENSELVLVKDIDLYSICEHHLLPFFGKVHIAYVPDGKVVGLSKLARAAEVFARRPQIQERLTEQIADAVMENLAPKGVMIVVEAEHMCMTMRGVRKPGTKTTTMACRGCLQGDDAALSRILLMLK